MLTGAFVFKGGHRVCFLKMIGMIIPRRVCRACSKENSTRSAGYAQRSIVLRAVKQNRSKEIEYSKEYTVCALL